MKKILFMMFICIFIVVAVAAPSYGAKDAAQGAAATNAPRIRQAVGFLIRFEVYDDQKRIY